MPPPKAVLTSIDATLSAAGFSRQRAIWNRANGALVDVANVQVSKSFDRMTINLGVLVRPVYDVCWDEPAPAFAEEIHCTVRTRIGMLSDGKDRWWSCSDPGAAAEMSELVRAYGLPFFERMSSLDAMLESLKTTKVPLEALYIGAIQARLGDLDQARTTFANLELRGAWQKRSEEIAQRLGLSAT